MYIRKESNTLSLNELENRAHARLLTLNDCLELLASPDSGLPLKLHQDQMQFSDGENYYDIREQLPLLLPTKLSTYFTERLEVPFNHYQDAFLQYYLLATIKQFGEINSTPSEVAAQRHFFRLSEFLANCSGLTLDVGCDDPLLSASLFPSSVQYVGLDPFCKRSIPFRVIGVGEYLPFLSESVDNVMFNTSLDHILDWRRALSEAKRVLKPGGELYIASFIWSDKATLITDTVHFHHFRYYEILGAIEELGLNYTESQIYESPKGDIHRHGLYLKAKKI